MVTTLQTYSRRGSHMHSVASTNALASREALLHVCTYALVLYRIGCVLFVRLVALFSVSISVSQMGEGMKGQRLGERTILFCFYHMQALSEDDSEVRDHLFNCIHLSKPPLQIHNKVCCHMGSHKMKV